VQRSAENTLKSESVIITVLYSWVKLFTVIS